MSLDGTGRIDTADIRRRYPLAEVAARYGLKLHRSGADRLAARCPFHDDREPSLMFYVRDPSDEHFYCFGCRAHGDVIRFVELTERLPFRAAVAALTGGMTGTRAPARPPAPRSSPRDTRRARVRGLVERVCLAIAIDLYHHRLLREPAALAYCAARGLNQAALARHRIGYAPRDSGGNDLAAALARRGLPLTAARGAGLLDRRGREFLAGRIIIPEVRGGRPIWAIGRALPWSSAGPRYLGLPGPKPLLGLDDARGRREVYLTEGPFDRLTLSGWGLPALALAGTHARPEAVDALTVFPRIYLALDDDDAGRRATAALQERLGPRAVAVPLPGVKDVADLGRRPDGRDRFLRAAADSSTAARAA